MLDYVMNTPEDGLRSSAGKVKHLPTVNGE